MYTLQITAGKSDHTIYSAWSAWECVQFARKCGYPLDEVWVFDTYENLYILGTCVESLWGGNPFKRENSYLFPLCFLNL